MRLLFAPLARALLARAFLGGDLLAFAARFRQADRDRLFPALHGLAAAPTFERAAPALVHRSLHVLGSALRCLACHDPSRSDVEGLFATQSVKQRFLSAAAPHSAGTSMVTESMNRTIRRRHRDMSALSSASEASAAAMTKRHRSSSRSDHPCRPSAHRS